MTLDAEEQQNELQMLAGLRCSPQLLSPVATVERKAARLGGLVI